mmetsp:Transcript_84344/g.223440  ORF Transcript_84344/g.223440 Transcript_84344/m.223440 type:complete len:557 (+) Transcript_84344:133-1803(+)
MPPVSELSFRRAMINLTDAGRLGEGEDLNDALLDFFTRLGQFLIPAKGDEETPCVFLGAHFFKQLRSAFATSGEQGWKNVQNWAKRKAGGLFKPQYAAFVVPINEDLKDDKGQDAGNHWWLALILNPAGGARAEPTAVMCLDSMQRRQKTFDPPLRGSLQGSRGGYTVEVTQVEQAGYLLIVSFSARGDGSQGAIQRPEKSRLLADGVVSSNPTLGLRINMPGNEDVPGHFEGTLTFSLDGRVRASTFAFAFGEGAYSPITMEFDPFVLTPLQKDVSRFIGGYLAKEWDTNGPDKKLKFEKTSARALVADVHQQENLNDCGVFVLENSLRSLSMKRDFLLSMAGASPKVLTSFPWPTQQDITARKEKLKAITARLFAVAAEKGCADVEKLMKDDADLKNEVRLSLTDGENSQLAKWAGSLQKALASAQTEKEKADAEYKEKEEAVQAKREALRQKREEEKKAEEEARRSPKRKPQPERSRSRSGSESESRRRPAKKKAGKKKGRSDSRSDSEAPRKKGKKEAPAKKSKAGAKGKKRKGDSSRSPSESRSPSRRRRR